MTALICSLSAEIDSLTAEDLVHDGFSVALTHWRENGIPKNAEGWVYTVCRNKALNYVRSASNKIPVKDTHAIEDSFSELPIKDPYLRLLFLCANPDLPPKSQVAITLKYVTNLKVEAISRLFGMTVDGIDKILIRARQKIKAEQILKETTDPVSLCSRLSTVHKIIYLIFNEGYKSSWGKTIIREELCEEALIINTALLESGLANTDTMALHALMLFNAARIKSRFSEDGEIIELEKQDRSLWDPGMIALGLEFLNRSKDGPISTYHLEASISYLHCSATSFELTKWELIVRLYGQLLQITPNPFAEVNYSIALFYAGERERALTILNRLHAHPFLHQYFLLTATLGKLYLLKGDHVIARKWLERALDQTHHLAEKTLIHKLISCCRF